MAALYYYANALWLEQFGKGDRYLFREPFLYLEPAGEHFGDSGEFREPDH
jgi:hypothetical protein